MGDRRIFYPSIAAILAMLVAAAAGYLWLPRADVPLPLVADCRLDRQACSAALPGGGRVEMALEPRPVPASAPMRVTVTVEGEQPGRVEVGFQGVDMNMGLHRLQLRTAADGRHVGETTLPVCVTGRMVWQATVMLEIGRRNITVPFRFESGF
ncbi:MAG: hypothetical protein HZC23_00115 [Rhodocyclales bacterium]|nr:hypothetical protein [Rhodocyclales bacterium]